MRIFAQELRPTHAVCVWAMQHQKDSTSPIPHKYFLAVRRDFGAVQCVASAGCDNSTKTSWSDCTEPGK